MTARKRVIFLFLDGVGLGPNDPGSNPLAAGRYPTLRRLLNDKDLTIDTGRYSTGIAELVPVDALLGVSGRPQSATGQATILTGINAAGCLGEHYGPRPDDRVRAVIDEGNLFRRLSQLRLRGYFCNAYPQRYFDAVERGKRLLSAVPYAAKSGGQQLANSVDMGEGRALAADFTGEGWRVELGYDDVPVYTPMEAGRQLWQVAQPYDFVFFEHWLTDLLGHRMQLSAAVENFQRFDAFLGGLSGVADLQNTLIIVASDHGNVEDCTHRKHTKNPALALLVGQGGTRYAEKLQSLTDFAPMVLDYLQG